MECVTVEELWMVADRIVDFRFFVNFHRSGPEKIFWTVTENIIYASKNLLIKQKMSSTWCVLLWKDYGWFLIELLIFDFSSNLTAPDMQKFTFFELSQKMLVMHQKSSLSSKDLINMVSVSLEVLWIVPDRISVFVKFQSSGSAIIFSFWTLKKHVSYASQKLLIKQKTSSTWCVLLWKGFWYSCRFSIFRQISQLRTCKNFQFLNCQRAC